MVRIFDYNKTLNKIISLNFKDMTYNPQIFTILNDKKDITNGLKLEMLQSKVFIFLIGIFQTFEITLIKKH
jgi:hypothetical protein